MSRREGAPAWIEFGAVDPDASFEFYSGLFGWTADEPLVGDYRLLRLDGRIVAGLAPDTSDAWRVFLTASDSATTLERVKTAGGTVDIRPESLAGLGSRAWVTDPAGVGVGVWQAESLEGIEVERVHGSPCWYELHSHDYAASVSFYSEAFAWTVSSIGDTDQFRMVIFPAGSGYDAVGGIYDASRDPDSLEPSWLVYFTVDDADAAAARVDELGGVVLKGPEDTAWGRVGYALDPLGAKFGILQLPERAG